MLVAVFSISTVYSITQTLMVRSIHTLMQHISSRVSLPPGQVLQKDLRHPTLHPTFTLQWKKYFWWGKLTMILQRTSKQVSQNTTSRRLPASFTYLNQIRPYPTMFMYTSLWKMYPSCSKVEHSLNYLESQNVILRALCHITKYAWERLLCCFNPSLSPMLYVNRFKYIYSTIVPPNGLGFKLQLSKCMPLKQHEKCQNQHYCYYFVKWTIIVSNILNYSKCKGRWQLKN